MEANSELADNTQAILNRIVWETTESAPLDALGLVRQLRGAVGELETQLVRDARAMGATWDEIGDALRISKQAASKRFR